MDKGEKKETYCTFANILAVLSLLATIILGAFAQQLTITTIVLGIYGLVFIAWFIFREWDFSRREQELIRKAKYAEAAALIAQCATYLKITDKAIKSGNQELADTEIRNSLQSFAEVFSLITGVPCRACIKSVNLIEEIKDKNNTVIFNKAYVTRTFVRGHKHESSADEQWVPILENSDFEFLIRNRDHRFWYSNDISAEPPSYKNSSLSGLEGNAREEYFKNNKYKYISANVWPISIHDSISSEMDDVIGFLCIDSKTRNVFNDGYDTELGFGFAESLSPVLYNYAEVFQKSQFDERNS